MLRFVFALSLGAVFLTQPALAATDEADRARIQLLEDQVVVLKEEVRRLRLMTSEMQTRLNQVNIILHDLQKPQVVEVKEEPDECTTRIADLTQKKDMLMSMGLKESHPDIVNISNVLEKLSSECTTKSR
ncbi:hypothetical protein ACFO5Q_02430 [Kordiimonas lipolytica]|uniref:YbgF trimerisation domain-containing protein n=1 Tax=Kordiimonas lipolytica TaxID=1662421 RepID=A0ABV8U679_9PROT|nr:hypothetical protein [Kordiimonas lipolytica]